MKKAIRIIFFSILTVVISITGLIVFGLYSLSIEDHYGDLQIVYYKAKDNDIIVNEETETFGKLEKDWTSIKVIDGSNPAIDLYPWAFKGNDRVNLKIFRPNLEINSFEQMDYDAFKKMMADQNLGPFLEFQNY